jgi:hypothetical protein
MTMREIQDLTLDLARGAERLDELFAGRAAAFEGWLQHSQPGERGGVRITAEPLAPLPRTQRIASNSQPPVIPPRYVVKAGGTDTDLLVPQHGFARPIVRVFVVTPTMIPFGSIFSNLALLTSGITKLLLKGFISNCFGFLPRI